MQLNLMTEKHVKYLKENFDIDEKRFVSICEEDGEELAKLLDDLTWKECDAADEYNKTGEYSEDGLCAIELIDIICGPYEKNQASENKMKTALSILSKEQIEFICKECSVTQAELFDMDDDMLYDKVYDVMCDIECAETPSSNEPLSEHCQMASDLVTIMGNFLCAEDEMDDDEED